MLHKAVVLLLPLALACTGSVAPRARQPPPPEAAATPSFDQETAERGQEVAVTVVEIEGRLLRGPKEAGVGTLSVGDGMVRWENDRRRNRSFSLQGRVVSEATLLCAERAGSDICLELELKTVTGDKYRFRDVAWAAGDNAHILQVYEALQEQHPRIVFGERRVDKIS
ncbi:MAG TPA: hypothetical protein VMT85_07135 [Thermoanaerobaculia bacterium]|nr:hypothetical protein [Thermoanaerobaculia bacterium]